MSEKIITPTFHISYPQVFEPKANDQGEFFYSASFVFPAGTDLSKLKEAAVEAGREKFGTKFDAGVKAGTYKLPFRTDTEDKGYPEGATFFSAKTKTKPGIVSRYPGPDNKPQAIHDEDAVYPGALFRASIRFYGYEAKGNKGVGVALNNLQKVGDSDRWDGRMKAEDEFEADSDEAAGGNDLLD
jgi:hypothetical protein